MTTAVLIPTIKGREQFLQQAKNLISEQTITPSFIEIVDDEQRNLKVVDVAWRYKIGIQRCLKKGADVIIFWEDDDWYKYNYIELMLKHWVMKGSPDVFGISRTIYYNIVKRKYMFMDHPDRASMMSTMVTKNFKPKWEDKQNPFVDLLIWKESEYKKRTWDIPFEKSIAIGIKHGIGLCAGGGHRWRDEKYPYDDSNLRFLSFIVDKDSLNFYSNFYVGQE
jgi:hypothetical protein